MSPSNAHIVRFGPFQLDLRAAELHHDGTKAKLPEQPFQVLTALLEHPGDVVTREELRQRLWGSETFVDFEQGLNTAVRRLRELLGDSAEKPRYIETLPRHGYRLIVDVEKPEPVPTTPTSARSWRTIAVAALGFAVVTAAALYLYEALRTTSVAVLPLENLSGNPAEESFADEMTKTLIAELSETRGLRVAPWQSVAPYKGSNQPVPQTARELHVDALVEGSVLRAVGKVRITAQLVQALEVVPKRLSRWAHPLVPRP